MFLEFINHLASRRFQCGFSAGFIPKACPVEKLCFRSCTETFLCFAILADPGWPTAREKVGYC